MRSASQSILVNAISVRTGGAQTFLMNLLPQLANLTPCWNYHLLVRQERELLYQSLPGNVIINAIPNDLVATYLKRLKFEHITIPMLHRQGKYSLHFQIDEMLSPVITALCVPSVAVFHTTPMVMFDDSTGDNWVFRQYAQLIRRLAAQNARLPVTVSHHAKAEFAGLYPAARDRFRVVYHGVDLVHFSPEKANNTFIQQLGITRPYILSISNRFEWKNYYRLVQSYQQLVQAHKIPYDLVLVGEAKKSSEEKRINEYISKCNLNDRIHLIDFVAQVDLPQIYRGALAYVFPSMRETFGMTVLEAMACGTPVVCARWGPLPEVAGDAACYFNPLDIDNMAAVIFKVTTDSTLRDELCHRGLEHMRYFTWEQAAIGYHRLLIEATCYQ